jgi:hypothetical protein
LHNSIDSLINISYSFGQNKSKDTMIESGISGSSIDICNIVCILRALMFIIISECISGISAMNE